MMEEKKYKKNEENVNNNFPPRQGGKKSGFSFYWIYAVLLAVLIGMSFWGFNDSISEINNVQLKKMIVQGDVDKIVIMTQKQIANIFINPDHINSDTLYTKAFETNQKGPHFYMNIDIGSFNTFIKETEKSLLEQETLGKIDEEKHAIEKNFKNIVVLTDNSKSWSFDNIFWMLFLAVPIILIIMMMRGMGRGGGMSMFSIGKSKAQLYDKDTHVVITFKDVAGLEGAKEEVVEIVDF